MDDHELEPKKILNAKKEPIVADEAVALAKKASKIHVAKGKKVVEFSLRAGKVQGETTDEDLRKAIVGPSGNLRAPTLWVGKTLYVGFHPEMYEQML